MNPWGLSEPGANNPSTSHPAIIPPAELQAQIDQMVKAAVEVSLKGVAASVKKKKSSSTSKNPAISTKGTPDKGKATQTRRVSVLPEGTSRPALSTPKRSDRSKSAPPEISNSVGKKPNKVLKSIKESKNAVFIHIKMLWGLLKSDSVPEAPDLGDLQEFYHNFSREDHINQAAATGSSRHELINTSEVQILKDARTGRIRIGNSYLNVGDNFIRYAKGLMARLGFRVWRPNLDEDSNSLYNSACRIAAVTTFQELAGAKAYAYLNINPEAVQNMAFLIQSYNHFVHFLMLEKFKKEQKEAGKLKKDVRHKNVQKNRERLAASRLEFAIINKLPERYQKILTPISAHSDDEAVEGKGFFKIKTLPYRSDNANRFFRQLDILMIKAAEQQPNIRRRIRKLPKNPEMSTYTAAPTGLPIDFYDPKWYLELTSSQQQKIPDLTNVAFLPDASKSLLPKAQRHLNPYGLVASTTSEDSDGEGGEEGEDENDEGEGIDLDGTSPDVSEDEFYEEGDAGDLYNKPIEENDGDDETDDEQDEDYEEENDDERSEAHHRPMEGVEEDEEVWA
ncbi:uncharacterized protein PGTG_05116 [Puccinia graminis f. sp. tritici CRL 75-36-700-3]|uniref:Uncharacterized protein n=1 Tax=Puccinia graminis f. sp. tritici (strain CRL 75-36-700-3 / race SCCL) TaxID=418459 RepID=E3K6G9_PUCGT|nr:uncharacterized protein PGTG_05116 [Puccinia graminis f. sp. tritici CRL 75-36-700-3]EFP79891.1 hypothetical protein PGTG_05116 [Puccinia graminis f. sp. tritici CRL 75-36-700-3]